MVPRGDNGFEPKNPQIRMNTKFLGSERMGNTPSLVSDGVLKPIKSAFLTKTTLRRRNATFVPESHTVSVPEAGPSLCLNDGHGHSIDNVINRASS